MSTYTQILYQIVFSTKHRNPTLLEESRDLLFKDIWGILNNKKCHLYCINGAEDHIRIVTHIHPIVAVSSLIKDIILGSNDYIKKNRIFLDFSGWQEGYGAFTYSISEKERLIRYVKHQQDHHKRFTYKEELTTLLNEHQVEFNEKYLL